MKKQTFGTILTLILAIFSPTTTNAAISQFPVDIYGHTDSVRNTWTDDTVDAQDNDVVGDVDWFRPEPGQNFNNPNGVYIGSLKKFSGVSIAIGNSPLRQGKMARFDFFYGAIVHNAVDEVVFKPLEVKDIDGGLSVSNRTYRYTFVPPADWNSAITPHVRAPGMFYIKMVCIENCTNGGPDGDFQVNQITLQQEILLQRLPNNRCFLRPLSPQCLRHL